MSSYERALESLRRIEEADIDRHRPKHEPERPARREEKVDQLTEKVNQQWTSIPLSEWVDE